MVKIQQMFLGSVMSSLSQNPTQEEQNQVSHLGKPRPFLLKTPAETTSSISRLTTCKPPLGLEHYRVLRTSTRCIKAFRCSEQHPAVPLAAPQPESPRTTRKAGSQANTPRPVGAHPRPGSSARSPRGDAAYPSRRAQPARPPMARRDTGRRAGLGGTGRDPARHSPRSAAARHRGALPPTQPPARSQANRRWRWWEEGGCFRARSGSAGSGERRRGGRPGSCRGSCSRSERGRQVSGGGGSGRRSVRAGAGAEPVVSPASSAGPA